MNACFYFPTLEPSHVVVEMSEEHAHVLTKNMVSGLSSFVKAGAAGASSNLFVQLPPSFF